VSSYFVGSSIWDVDTPVLAVDLEALERNIKGSADFFDQAGVAWRPHTKGQKLPALAHKQLEAGAIGVTCAKLGEAEVMAASGIQSILVANQIVGRHKARRLANLCRQAEVIVAVDSETNARELHEAAVRYDSQLPVVIEVNIGMDRAGVLPGEPSVKLATILHELEGLRFMGVMGWEGHARRFQDPGERKSACEESVEKLVATAELCRSRGLPVQIVSCGGTGTHEYSSHVPGVTEIQAGGIIFNDMYYARVGVEHEFALTVVSTVVSRPHPRRIITDAGKKTMSSDAAEPKPLGVGKVEALSFSAEHGTILTVEDSAVEIGDRVQWIVGYSDTTVALHDELYAVRDERVEVVWPIPGRGKLR
jgi:D-serine deaminase-like pyridoxal phosphate-dependent protein